jgi:hypothetical protein
MSFEHDREHESAGIDPEVFGLNKIAQTICRAGQRFPEERGLSRNKAFVAAIEEASLNQTGGKTGVSRAESGCEIAFAGVPTQESRLHRLLESTDEAIAAALNCPLKEFWTRIQKIARQLRGMTAHIRYVTPEGQERFPDDTAGTGGQYDAIDPQTLGHSAFPASPQVGDDGTLDIRRRTPAANP